MHCCYWSSKCIKIRPNSMKTLKTMCHPLKSIPGYIVPCTTKHWAWWEDVPFRRVVSDRRFPWGRGQAPPCILCCSSWIQCGRQKASLEADDDPQQSTAPWTDNASHKQLIIWLSKYATGITLHALSMPDCPSRAQKLTWALICFKSMQSIHLHP